MKVLVTGAKGFIGKNLCESLKNIRDGRDGRSRYRALLPLEIWEYDRDSKCDEMDEWCAHADFVFNLAGVNRPKNQGEFMEGNFGFASELLGLLEKHRNRCPVMLASSVQASLQGRFEGSEYGRSKLAGERLFRAYSDRTGAPVLIYRFPNVYGKWCRPNYNSAVATFCYNMARGLPVTVSDPNVELELLYIDDLVGEMLSALVGEEGRVESAGGDLCVAGPTNMASLGEIVELIAGFKGARDSIAVPDVTPGSLSKKLYSTYLSYLDPSDLSYSLKANRDGRGSFTEVLRTADRGQVSVNISKPGVTKGNHWHHTKWEKFCVVSGEASIRLRQVGQDEAGRPYPVVEYRVSGQDPEVVEMAPGFTHCIENLSDDRDLVTLMWANEAFDPENPDTFSEEV